MNPYESPAADETTLQKLPPVSAVAGPSLTKRKIVSGILLTVGTLTLLLLNGQAFTNSLICMALFGVSGLMWVTLALAETQKTQLARWVILAHAVLIAVVAINLPANYAFQKSFNAKMDEFRAARAKAGQK